MTKKTYVLMVSKHFMKDHPMAGEPTGFSNKINVGEKIHTIRGNYDYWKKIVDKVNSGDAVLSLRSWIDKPYRSKQMEFAEFSSLGIEKIRINFPDGEMYIEDMDIWDEDEWREIADNDGLSFDNFRTWFEEPFEGCIIHFTDFTYAK